MIDESGLRHPYERAIFVGTVVVNVAFMAASIYLITYGSHWLEAHPRLAKYAGELRAAAILAILSPPLIVVLRNTRRAIVRGGAVPLSPAQLPEIYASFERFCDTLGLRPVPQLFLTEDAIDEPSNAYSTWHGNYVVLRGKYLQHDIEGFRDVYEFFLARELGRVRLGHTRWWDELLVSYVVHLPFLRNPLAHARTYSHDRYALALAPWSVRGLVIQASGRLIIRRIAVPEYLRESVTYGGFWARLASLSRRSPHVALRLRRLYEAGLLDFALSSGEAAPPAAPALARPAESEGAPRV